MKKWVVVNAEGLVVHGFDADDAYAEQFHQRLGGMPEKPDWYSDTVTLRDVTDEPERPMPGWVKYKTTAGWKKTPVVTTPPAKNPPDVPRTGRATEVGRETTGTRTHIYWSDGSMTWESP